MPSSLLRAISSLLSLLLCVISPVVAAYPFSAYPFSVNDLTIVSVNSSECINVYTMALNCTLPAELLITVAGVSLATPVGPSGLQPYLFVRFVLAGLDSALTFSGLVNRGSTNQLSATLLLDGFAVGMMGRLLSLSVYDTLSGNSSASFAKLSIASLPTPTLSTISGCNGGGTLGTATMGCLPDADLLTVTGSGFSVLESVERFDIVLTDSVRRQSSAPGYGTVVVVNDSLVLLSLRDIYATLLQVNHFGGGLLGLGFSMPWYSTLERQWVSWDTNQLDLSFAPLPPPNVTRVATSNCPFSNGGYVGCEPNAPFYFFGDYLFDLTITLEAAGKEPQLCTRDSFGDSFVLPIVTDDEDGLTWDVVFTHPAGTQRFPALVVYYTLPTIAYVVPCNTYGLYQYVGNIYCLPGETLTVRGMRFPADPELAVVFVELDSQRQLLDNATCAQLVRVDSTTLTCTVPSLDGTPLSALYDSNIALQVVFSGSQLSTADTGGRFIASPESAVIANVSGCEANNGSFGLLRCRGGDVVVLQGAHLLRLVVLMQFSTSYDSSSCLVLPNSTNERVSCQLPFILPEDDSVRADVPYTVHYLTYDDRLQPSYGHPFTLTWTWAAPASASGNTAQKQLGAGLLAVATVLPVLSVLLAVVVGIVLCKRCNWLKHNIGRSVSDTAGERADGEGQWTGQRPAYARAWPRGDALEMTS